MDSQSTILYVINYQSEHGSTAYATILEDNYSWNVQGVLIFPAATGAHEPTEATK